jgi:hypothetical protein
MAYDYNPSYLEGRNKEDHGLRSAWAKKKKKVRPYLKNSQHKKGLVE